MFGVSNILILLFFCFLITSFSMFFVYLHQPGKKQRHKREFEVAVKNEADENSNKTRSAKSKTVDNVFLVTPFRRKAQTNSTSIPLHSASPHEPDRASTDYLIKPNMPISACWESPCQKNLDVDWRMVVLIKSSAGRPAIRELLRRTWAALSYVDRAQIASIFVIGIANRKQQLIIDEEVKRYGDILQLNVSDDYRFIALKTLGGMQWAVENLNDVDYYMSSDDDMLINMVGLVKMLNQLIEHVRRNHWPDFPILCVHRTKFVDIPDRRNSSKYYISTDEYKWPYYPDYCLGGAYTTSVGVVRQLWKSSRGVEPVKMDDVWITGILRTKIGMPRQYVRQLDSSLATHYYGFRRNKSKTRRGFMKAEWDKLQTQFEKSVVCRCG